jgi:cytochrome c-type biogenesis protein CcmF
MDIQYIGEHLLPGQLGKFSIILSFIAALFSIFLYYQASKENPLDSDKWKNWGRKVYFIHSAFIFIAGVMLMYILLNRYYEYRYVWVHAENDLGLGYLLAAFWAGQEGSFLFWTLCQMVFGLLLIRYAGKWESPVMVTVSLSQLFMVSMMLGVHVFGTRIGMSPFLLLREVPENAASDFFQNPNYLSLIVDGNGLNPLLRNFWMLSHPPVLFIGFAAALVPFAYGIAGLWKREYISWITPALPWTLLAVFFLGAGILLGGVWAYESLTFGGFWAWDPIENASLVPWLILVAALHLKLVARKKRENLFPTFLFTFLTFVFVIYSTYLTRSGVLGDTSVHSFGNDGMGLQILSYIFVFLILAIVMLTKHFRKFPSKENEEPLSREFWLFIGAMVLVLSAFQIIFTTSIPVINRLVGSDLTPPVNVVQHYNTWQLPFAIFVALLIGFAQFMKWGKNEPGTFFFSSLFSLSLSFVFTAVIFLFSDISHAAHVIFLFAGLFAMFSSLDMVLRFRKKLINTPALISHLGMALFFVAILITFSQQQTISRNTSGFMLGESLSENENLLLIRDEILPMGEFHVTYSDRQISGEDIVYQIDFLKKNQEGEFYKAFSSFPTIKLNERMGNVYNPYAKIYLTRDIFTYITFADVHSHTHHHPPQLLEQLTLTRNDTVSVENNQVVLTEIDVKNRSIEGDIDPDNIELEAIIEFITHFGRVYRATPVFRVQDQQVNYDDAVVTELDYRVRFKGVTEKAYTIDIEVFREQPDFIIIKTIIFPYINLLWISCIVMLLGFWLSFRKRWKSRNNPVAEIENE